MTIKGAASGVYRWAVGEDALNIQWVLRTDLGLRREINEDSVVCAPPIFAVADGMGGHEAGEVASKCVVERLSELEGRPAGAAAITSALRGAVADLVDSGVDSGSGTTVTGIAFLADALEAEVFNIGDSRMYLFRDGALEQLTKDHSVVQELVDAGQITEGEAETHPHANVITRAVGFHDDPVPETIRVALTAGDRVLLCTDGLSKEISARELGHLLVSEEPLERVAQRLIDAALEHGGRDNVTLIVIDVLSGSPAN